MISSRCTLPRYMYVCMYIYIYMYMYIPKCLLRKCNWGMMQRVSCIFSDSVWIHRDNIYSNLLALRIFQNNTFALRISQHTMQFDLEYSKINVCTQNILALRIFQMLTHIDLKTSFIFSPVLLLQSMHCPNDSNLVSSLNSNVPVPCES